MQVSVTSTGLGGQHFWDLLRESNVEQVACGFYVEARSVLPKRGGAILQVSNTPHLPPPSPASANPDGRFAIKISQEGPLNPLVFLCQSKPQMGGFQCHHSLRGFCVESQSVLPKCGGTILPPPPPLPCLSSRYHHQSQQGERIKSSPTHYPHET